jgi:hypothetical protein
MPSKFLYLYLQTMPNPAGGVMRLSFGQLMEELSMPAQWLKNAMAEMSANGLIQACGNMVFVPRGIERIDNPNMVTSAMRKLERLDTQDGPIPAPIWGHLLQALSAMLEEKPYLSALQDYASEKMQSAPESVAQWDAGAAWMQDAEWGLAAASRDTLSDKNGNGAAASFSPRELSLIQTIIQSTLSSTIPALLQPVISLLRQNDVAATPAAGPATCEAGMAPNTGPTEDAEKDLSGSSLDADVDAALERIGGLRPSNPVAYLFPVKADHSGDRHKVFTNHVHHMHHDLGDLLDIDSEMDQMLAYLEANPEKIPARAKANEYIWNWMRRKHRQVAARQGLQPDGLPSAKKEAMATSAEAAQNTPCDNANVSTLRESLPLFDDVTGVSEELTTGTATGTAMATVETPKPKKPEMPEGFDAFWALYPRHDAKVNAVKAWKKHGCNKVLQVILDDISHRKERVWHDPQFIPMPSTYLNQRRWEDEGVVAQGAFKGTVIKGVVQPDNKTFFEEVERIRMAKEARREEVERILNETCDDSNCVDLPPENWRVAS